MDLYHVRKELAMGIPLTHINLRVTDYARVSTDHLEQKKSLQNQVEHFEHYIKDNPNWTYVKGYIDDGITGTSDIKRDSFMKMLEDARNNKFDLIVTKEISRFSRNTLDSIKYTRELLSYGVAVLFVNDNINTALPDSELRLTIMASMAQDEIRRLSERVKFGMERAIERGEILGNNQLYGYQKDKNTGVLTIVEEEAEVVRRIYELYAIDELSLSSIVKTLNGEKKKTRTGKSWCVSTISRMLENPKYKGYYCARKSEIVDFMTKKIKYLKKEDWVLYEARERIPPIIDEEVWQRASVRLESRKKAFKKRVEDKSLYKNRYLYSAKIYCMEHGTVFHRRAFRKSSEDKTWVCSEYLKNGKNSCPSPNLRESELNFIFEDLIQRLPIDLNDVTSLLLSFYKNFEETLHVQNQIDVLQKEIRNVHSQKDKLLQLHLEDSLSSIEFKDKNNIFNEKIKKLTEELDALKNRKKEKEPLKELEDVLKEKVNAKEIFSQVVAILLKRVEASLVGNTPNNINLNIFLSYDTPYFIHKKEAFLENTYTFKRGYDTTGTKRYQVFYQVHFYAS